MAAINQVSVSGGGSVAANGSDGTNIVAATSNCLTITISPPTAAANGATVSPANRCYTNPTLVDVIAYNAGGYTFSSFSGGLTGTTSNQAVMVSGSVNITANFMTSFTLSPANQNANIVIPTNGTPVTATYTFSSGDPHDISGCYLYRSNGTLSQDVTATITQRTASSLSVQYTAAPGAQFSPVDPICDCFEDGCDPVNLPGGDPEPPPQLSCSPGTVTRGNSVTCTVTGSTVTQWYFSGDGVGVSGPAGGSTWAGPMVISGTVTATTSDNSTLTQTITVNPRSNFPAVAMPAAQLVANGSLLSAIQLPLLTSPPCQMDGCMGDSAYGWGYSMNSPVITGGPNLGLYFVMSLTDTSLYG